MARTSANPALLLMVIALAATPSGAAPDTTAGNLTGAWRLNHSASDIGGGPGGEGPEGGMRGRPPGGAGGPGGGFGGPGGMGPGGFGRGEPSDEDRQQMKDRVERVRALMQAVDRLTITQDGDRVVIVDGEGRTERLVPNGKKEQHLVGNVQAELRTTWEAGRLVSDIALGGGLTFRRTMAVETAPDGARRLVIELTPKGGSDGKRPPMKRVYDLVE